MLLPNQLTVLRILLTPVFLVFFLSDNSTYIQLSFVVFIVAAVTDWYDGWLARRFNYITDWGKFMDPLADKILTSAAFFAFVFIDFFELWMVLVIIFRDLLITGLRLYSDFRGYSFRTSRLAQWKTFIQMGFLVYCLFFRTLMSVESVYGGNEDWFSVFLNEYFIYYAMLSLTLFTFFTGISYLVKNRELIRRLADFEG